MFQEKLNLINFKAEMKDFFLFIYFYIYIYIFSLKQNTEFDLLNENFV